MIIPKNLAWGRNILGVDDRHEFSSGLKIEYVPPPLRPPFTTPVMGLKISFYQITIPTPFKNPSFSLSLTRPAQG